ncbi:MAG: DUF4920 domain-containing protein [Deltaproteobacteria bacterium]
MNRTTVVAILAVAAWGCSRPEAAAAHPQVQPESTAHAGAPSHPSGTPTPQPADPGAHAAAGAAAVPGGPRHYGAAIEPGIPSVHLAQVATTPAQFNGQTIRVEGEITAVCQHMGCWMEIRDDATQAHIRMHGHSFFLPRDVSGHRASVAATIVSAQGATECDGPGHAEHAAAPGATAAAPGAAAPTAAAPTAAAPRVAQIELDALGVDVFN